eukprot:3246047-Prorocentrum_lima.AAC.1
MKPDLLLGVIPTVRALPLSRSLRIELHLVHQLALALLTHECGAVVLLQCREAHGHEQRPMQQL